MVCQGRRMPGTFRSRLCLFCRSVCCVKASDAAHLLRSVVCAVTPLDHLRPPHSRRVLTRWRMQPVADNTNVWSSDSRQAGVLPSLQQANVALLGRLWSGLIVGLRQLQ